MAGQGLSNRDFRAMLSAPSKAAETEGGEEKAGSSGGLSYDARKKAAESEVRAEMNREKMKKQKQRQKAAKSSSSSKKRTQKQSPGSAYRDRAKERREGKLEDYDSLGQADASVLLGSSGPSVLASMAPETSKEVDMEQSKFLGGDMEHTHLVKGLDYALLRKVRAEIEAEEKEKGGKEMQGVRKPAGTAGAGRGRGRGGGRGETLGSRVWGALVEGEQRYQRLLSGLEQAPAPFLHCAYLVDLDARKATAPTMLLNRPEEEEDDEDLVVCSFSEELIEKVAEICSYIARGKRRKKGAQVPAPAVPAVPEVADDDLSIFDDAEEEYVCDVVATAEKKQKEEGGERKAYFAKREEVEEKEKGPDVSSMGGFLSERQMKTLESLPKKRPREEVPEKQGSERDPSFVSDYYTECYAGSYEMGSGRNPVACDAGSSDEEDFSMMDTGVTNKKELRPWDFETQEEWERYMDRREATPQAAFQFGVKKGDRRRAKKLTKAAIATKDYHKAASKRRKVQ